MWSQNSLLGYIGEICLNLLISVGYFIENGVHLILFTSICLYHQAFYEIINRLVKEKIKECDGKFLFDMVRFHIMIKE